MRTDRERWDAKWEGNPVPAPPDPFVLAMLDHLELRTGRALDLAAGIGRHALELARRGLETEAWDVSPVGLRRLESVAAERNLEVRTRVIDLVEGGLPSDESNFDLVVVVSFLHRPLLPRLSELVAPGGWLVYATFTADWPGEKPPAEFRLAPGELARGLPGFEVVRSAELDGRAGLLARRPRSGAAVGPDVPGTA